MITTSKQLPPVLTIDGPSGVGKGTAAQQIAQRLGWHMLDSGALYRVLGQAAQRQQVALDDADALAVLAADLAVTFQPDTQTGETRIFLQGEDVSTAARSEAGGKLASQVAAIPAVRTALLARQRAFRQWPGLVADGRDMGTTLFADAPLKIFLLASAEERARRRCRQLQAKGEAVEFNQILQQMQERDARDEQRAVAPLRAAADAIQIDTSQLSIAEMLEKILAEITARDLAQ